jgi:hypothetical protein
MKFIVLVIALILQFTIREVFTTSQNHVVLQLRLEHAENEVDIYDEICQTADGYEAHENCAHYWRCSNWVPILMNCSDGLYWNPTEEECDFPWNVPSCPGGTREMPELTTPINNPSTVETVVTTDVPVASTDYNTNPGIITTLEPSPTTPSFPEICPPEGLHRVPYPGNCSMYYFCVNGHFTIESCAFGLLFDPITRNCQKAEDVDCVDPSMTTPAIPETCPEEGRHYLPYPGNCSLYYVCADGIPFVEECGRGLLFDPILAKCNFPELVDCRWAFPKCPAEGVVYLPIQGDCVKYVFCQDGIPEYLTCESDLVFDPGQGRCVEKSEYDCPFGWRNFWEALQFK